MHNYKTPPTIPPTYIQVHAVVWECDEGETDRHTDGRDHILPWLRLTRNVTKPLHYVWWTGSSGREMISVLVWVCKAVFVHTFDHSLHEVNPASGHNDVVASWTALPGASLTSAMTCVGFNFGISSCIFSNKTSYSPVIFCVIKARKTILFWHLALCWLDLFSSYNLQSHKIRLTLSSTSATSCYFVTMTSVTVASFFTDAFIIAHNDARMIGF